MMDYVRVQRGAAIRSRSRISYVAALLCLSTACYQYEEQFRPFPADLCPPELPSRSYSHVAADPGVVGLQGRVRGAFGPAPDAVPPDSSWPALADAWIQIEHTSGTAHTDSLGRFRIDSLGPGRYAVRVTRVGYRPRRDTVVVAANAGADWDVALEPQAVDGCPGFMSMVERKRVWRWPWQ